MSNSIFINIPCFSHLHIAEAAITMDMPIEPLYAKDNAVADGA